MVGDRLLDENADALIREIVLGFAAEITADFSTWKDIKKNVQQAFACFDRFLKRYAPGLPSLSAIDLSNMGGMAALIAYDQEAPLVSISLDSEFLLHQVIALRLHTAQQEDPRATATSLIKITQDLILSRFDNALSWAFNAGLTYFRTESTENILADFNIAPVRRPQIEALKAFATAIPEANLFIEKGYENYRRTVSGKVRSWAANYMNRLLELDALYAQIKPIDLPKALSMDDANRFFEGTGLDSAGLHHLNTELVNEFGKAHHALNRLLGKSSELPNTRYQDVEEIEHVEKFISDFIGKINIINNRIQQDTESADAMRDKARKEFAQSCHIQLPAGFDTPNSINRISGGNPDVNAAIESIEDNFNLVLKRQADHIESIRHWCQTKNISTNPLPSLIARERRLLEEKPGASAMISPEEQGLRRLIDRIGKVSRHMSLSSRSHVSNCFKALGVFKDEKQHNRYFFNQQGSLYRSPFSRSRHQSYEITSSLVSIDWLAVLSDLMNEIHKEAVVNGEVHRTAFKDWLQLRNLYYALQLDAIPDVLPRELAQIELPPSVIQVPALLQFELSRPSVNASVVRRIFNLYAIALQGLAFKAFRDQFIVRVKFQRIKQNRLLYVPKAKQWKPPVHLWNGEAPITQALNGEHMELVSDGVVDTTASFTKIASRLETAKGWRQWLVQAPHDWYFPMDILGESSGPIIGSECSKDGFKEPCSHVNAFRIKGPCSFKNLLDRSLTEDISIGDINLICDNRYSQSIHFENGHYRLRIKDNGYSASIAIPVTDSRPVIPSEQSKIFDRILAVDLGEVNIGYAVFDLKDFLKTGNATPLPLDRNYPNKVRGRQAVPSIRRLIKAVNKYRRIQQPNQKLQQRYSNALEKMRENVIGDVCNVIETLCAKYRAFPVLESSVKNFETGANQQKLVYGSVQQRYVYSSLRAHETERAQHWFGATVWKHPYLMVKEFQPEDGKKKINKAKFKVKPLSLFPGITVHPAGTSQTCCQCNRNPIATVYSTETQAFLVNEIGQVELPNGSIQLKRPKKFDFSQPEHKAEFTRLRRQKERIPLTEPIRAGRLTKDELLREIRFNLRRQNHSMQSKDTSQSQYRCVYIDCGYNGHADASAAINIGRKFLTEKIERNASLKNLDT